MRYFLIFDELSGPEGDLYKWDGTDLVSKSHTGWSDWSDQPRRGQSVEELLDGLSGSQGTWEETEAP